MSEIVTWRVTEKRVPAVVSNHEVLQEFRVRIVSVSGGCAEVVLADLTNPERPSESAEIDVTKLPSDVQEKAAPGLCLLWSIGMETDGSGTVRKFSEFHLV